MALLGVVRSRRTALSAAALAVVVAIPVSIAVAHQGFAVSAVDLFARDVWVTNGSKLLAGRLNMQIEELNGGVTMASRGFDVLQDGEDVFVYDDELGSVERIDPAYTTLGQRIEVPASSLVDYGGGALAVLDPSGLLWVVSASGDLQFDSATTQPSGEFGAGAQAVVTDKGVVWVLSPADAALFRVDGPGAPPVRVRDLGVEDAELTVVGEEPVVLDRSTREVVTPGGGRIALPGSPMRIQQPGAAADAVLVATGDALLRVGFDGSIATYDADLVSAATDPDEVAQPVALAGCLHAAWSSTGRYLGVCEGKDPTAASVPTTGPSRLVFRVNRNVVALNDVLAGDVWLVSENMRLVENWDEVTPPEQVDGEEGDEKASTQSFEDTLAERSEQNRAPIARPDDVGVRPGRTTILPVLDNDTDPDGDVLTISNLGEVSASAGTLQVIDGGRALQFTPADGASGTVSFRYTASDGRPGGVAETQVNVTIRQPEENLPPVPIRVSAITVEAGQTVTHNVLTDWRDPDGDELVLTGAAATTADIVRFRPDGQVTFTSASPETGQKSVTVTISDGTETVVGEFVVDVKAPGELNPVGTPDFAAGFVGDRVEIAPLDNDRSPSGERLSLQLIESLTDGITATVDLDRGVVVASAPAAGVYYLQYTLGAGPVKSSIGLIRVDIAEDPENPLPPVAVKDVAYVRPNEPAMVAALANDQSPSGRVIGIQSIDMPVGSEQVSVEVLGASFLRITAPSGMTEPLTFGYTISDGVSEAAAAVTVVPVPELEKHQAPIANDDATKVRVGDVATVAVLENDFHPDGVRMVLDPELVQAHVGADGLAFVTGSDVRFQAPTDPGQYSVTYRITDSFSESAVASVLFTVVAGDAENNQDPILPQLTARVFQGGKVVIDVPVSGVDPDGDSVQLIGAAGSSLGEVVATGSASFVYEAYEDTAGTDEFTYQVRDSSGATASGQVRIGVIPRPATVMPPTAVNDEIAMRPDRVASIPVLDNDSDPNGFDVALSPELLEVQDGIAASVDGRSVVVEAGADEGTYIVRYQIDNGHGGTDDAFVVVTVDADARLQPPTAVDQTVEVEDVVGLETVEVSALDGAGNPGGRVEDLVVSLDGANAAAGEVLDGGIVRVTLGPTRQAIAFRLTNVVDDLSAMAFIIVPAYTSDLPPTLKPELVATPPNIRVNETKEWRLSDILDVPSGREARIINPESAVAGRGNGESIALDEFTVRFTPEKDFRGETTLTFEVSDGASAEDPNGTRATIQMRVIVGDPNFEDVAPSFASTTVQIEAGDQATTVDLRAATSHPNPAILAQVAYSGLAGQSGGITGSVSGSTLTVQAPFGTQPGVTTTLTFDVTYASFTIPGQVQVVVVPSTRPLAQTVDDVEPEGRSSSTYTISPLANDFNPFAADGQTLTITKAVIEGDGLGATVSNTTSNVTVRTGSAKSGTVSVIYTVRDATDTAAREVQGRITVVVASAPEPVTSFSVDRSGSQSLSVVFDPPVSSNGAEITGYTVTMNGSPGVVSRTDCMPGSSCVFTGRTNGAVQTVTVSATNRVGTTVSSSLQQTPFGIPSAPSNPVLSTNSSTATASITPSWSAPADSGGGSITYNWSYTQGVGGSGSTGGTSGGSASVGAGDYAFQVQACNPAGCSGYVGASVHIDPAPPAILSVSRGAAYSSGWIIDIHTVNVPNGQYTICMDGQQPGGTRGWFSDQQCYTSTVTNGTASPTQFWLGAGYSGNFRIWVWISGKTGEYTALLW